MNERYLTAGEYPSFFEKLGGIRRRIAADLPLKPGMHILDLACGHGYFAVEVCRRFLDLRITAIDILETDVGRTRANAAQRGLGREVEAIRMDATAMSFPDAYFDAVVNFGGLEDIHMTRGEAGVERAFKEVARVLKPERRFCFGVMPPEEMETEAQRLEVAVFSDVCGATWLSAAAYEEMLAGAGLGPVGKMVYRTGRKLTADQAQQEIRFACKNVPKLYGVQTRSFEDVWARFGHAIEQHGLGQFSRVVMFTATKAGDR